MNRKMALFARGATCDVRNEEAREAAASWAAREPRADAPSPAADSRKK